MCNRVFGKVNCRTFWICAYSKPCSIKAQKIELPSLKSAWKLVEGVLRSFLLCARCHFEAMKYSLAWRLIVGTVHLVYRYRCSRSSNFCCNKYIRKVMYLELAKQFGLMDRVGRLWKGLVILYETTSTQHTLLSHARKPSLLGPNSVRVQSLVCPVHSRLLSWLCDLGVLSGHNRFWKDAVTGPIVQVFETPVFAQ